VDTLSIGGVFQEIEVLDPTELTVMSDFEGAAIGKAKGSVLTRVATCYPSSVDSDTKEHLINMVFDRDRGQIMAVDGVRIHAQDVKFKGKGRMYAETRYIAKLARLAKDTEIKIAVADDHNHLLFSFGKVRVWVAAEDAMAYPEIGKLIDEREGESAVTIDSKTLKQLFEQAGVVAARREHKDIRINLTFNGSLNVQAVSHMARYENLEVPYEAGEVNGSHSLEFNPNYLSAALKGIGKKAVIGIKGEADPIRFSDEKEGFTALVMPMRDQTKEPVPESEAEKVNEDQSAESDPEAEAA
jgi:DNA polymerase III sliding clamp (beta) subunit (PCNA family)